MNQSANPRVALTLRIYRALASGFPQEFQNAYGDEILQVSEDAIEWIWQRHGVTGLLRLLLDIAIRVPVEHMAELGKDIRYGARMLARSPGYTAVAVISLSLGIAIATCALSEMNGMVLRRLPVVTRPDELVAIQAPVSFPTYRRYRDQSDLFQSTAAYIAPVPFAALINGHTERIWGQIVTPSYFSTLGVRPFLGTFFGPRHEQPGQTPSAIVSYRLWTEQLGADTSIIGKTLRINGQPATITGVGPSEFLGASPMLYASDVWLPVSTDERTAPELAGHALERRDAIMFNVLGRLRPGATPSAAEAQLDAIAQQIEQEYPDADRSRKGRRVTLVEGGKLVPIRKQDQPFFASFLLIVAGLILLITCSNVANMGLARASARRKEIAIRLALGASRWRIVRQLMTESTIVATGAGVIGFLASAVTMRLLMRVRMPLPMPVAYDFQPDWRVLLFTLGLTAFTGLFFGLIPALRATRTDLTPSLKEGAQIDLGGHRRLSLRNVLMVSQVAASLTLLVMLGLLSVGIQSTLGIQTGFNPNGLYMLGLDPVRDGFTGAEADAFFQRMLERVQRLPAVSAACLTETIPVSLPASKIRFTSPTSHATATKAILPADRSTVGKDYFATAGIPIVLGRAFRREDESDQSTTVIVSEELVRKVWRGEDPIGRRLEIGNLDIAPAQMMWGTFDLRPPTPPAGQKTFEVVGVAHDVAGGLIVGEKHQVIYFPLRPSQYARPSLLGVTLLIRGVPGVDVLGAVQREIAATDARVTPFNAHSMAEHIEQFMGALRAATGTYAFVGAFGLILAAVGLAGVTAYSVTQRTHEIGIRVALGATAADVLGLVMREGATLIAIGTAIGMLGAWAGGRMLSAASSSVGRVTTTSQTDPLVTLGAPLLLAALAMIACYLPARRSTHIDPAVTLRQE